MNLAEICRDTGGRVHVAAVAFLLVCVPLTLNAEPSLSLDREVYDWGQQKTNRGEYKFEFNLKNEGDEELELSRVRATCGCTKVELGSDTLKPGETTQLTGILNMTGYEGRVTKAIVITSNDAVRATRVLRLQIQLPFAEEGVRLRLRHNAASLRDGDYRAYISLQNGDADKDCLITGVRLPEGWVCNTELPMKLPVQSRKLVRVSLPARLKPADAKAVDFVILTDRKGEERELKGQIVFPVPVPQPVPAVGDQPALNP